MKKAVRHLLSELVTCLFRLLPLQNRALFFTIRADGVLLENLQSVYDRCGCKKIVWAKMLPHTFGDLLRARLLLLTSRVIVTDDYVRYFRQIKLRRGQRVVQVWHAAGALKRFGLDAPSRLTPAEERATHAPYTAVCVSSEVVRPFYAAAFGLPLEKILPLGTPRTDALLDDSRCAALRADVETRLPMLEGKTVYLYAPTFRETDGVVTPFDPHLDFSAISGALSADEVLLVRRHPVMDTPFFAPGAFSNVLDVSDVSTQALLCRADALVTDYSSVLFDAALLGCPMAFYCPDKATYERAFYLDFDRDLPGEIVTQSADFLPALRRAVQQPDADKLRAFCRSQLGACDGHASVRVAALVQSYLK